MRAFISKCVFLSAAIAATACSAQFDYPTSLTSPSTDAPSSIALNVTVRSLTVGDSLKLSAVVNDGAGNPLPNQSVSWSSSNALVATVSAAGWVTAVAAGSAQVKAKSGNAEATATVAVATAPATPTPPTPEAPIPASATLLPATFATPMPSPVAGAQVIDVPVGGNLQQAIDAAKPGDVVQLAPGATYVGNFVLRNKNTSSGNWIIIRPSIADGSLPGEGTRMTPALASALKLPSIVSPNGQPALRTELGAHHYRLVALEVTVAPTWTGTQYGLISFGANDDGGQTTLASIAHDLIVDRSYVHGSATQNVRRGVALNSATSAVIDSHVSEIHEEGADAQAIAGWNGPGPYKIVNNYLEASTENILFGGGDPAIQGMIPSDIEIRRNHVYKQPSWRGGKWLIKNLLELKNAQRVLIEGNVFENNWEQAQDGSAMQLQSTNQSGTAPWSRTWDVTIHSNIIRNTGGGIVIAAAPQVYPATHARRFTVSNNLIQNVNVSGFTGTGRALSLFQDVADVTIVHNTIPAVTNSAITFDGNLATPTIRLVVRDNIFGGGTYGIIGAGTGAGQPTLQAWAPDGVFQNNVLIKDITGATFPTGNFYPKLGSDVGFENYAAGDFRLSLVSPFKNKATDGSDMGANVAALQAAVSGVVLP